MKKAAAATVLLGVLICALFLFSPAGLPELDRASQTMAVDETGTVLLAENRGDSAWIYGVDSEGIVSSAFRQAGGRVTLLASGESGVYFVLVPASESGWQLMRLSDGSAQAVLQNPVDRPDPPEAVSVSAESIDLTFRSGGSISVLRLPIEAVGEGETAESSELLSLMDLTLSGAETPVSAAFAEDRLFCLLEDGSVLSVRPGENGAKEPVGSGGCTVLSASRGSVWAYRQEAGTACGSAASLGGGAGVLLDGSAVLCGAGGPSGEMAALSAEDGGARLIRSSGGEVMRQSLSVPFRFRLMFQFPGLLILLAVYVLLAFAVLLTMLVCRRAHRLAARFTACCVCTALFAALAAGTVFAALSLGEEGTALEAQAQAATQVRAAALGEQDLHGALAAEGDRSALRPLLLPAEVTCGDGELQISAAILSADGAQVLLSAGQAAGAPAAQVSGLQVPEIPFSGETVSFREGGAICAVSAVPLVRYGETEGLLVTRAELRPPAEPWFRFYAVPLLAAVVVSVLAALLSFLMMRPLGQLVRRMRSVSEGGLTLAPVRTAADEIGDMWQSLREMSVALRIKDYETNATVRSFYRFVPRGLEQLLDRASIMETSLGDMANVSGTVGVLSIQNREEIRLSVDDGSYMAFLNDSYAVIDRQLASAGGLFLSSGFHPGGMEFLFRESPDQGLAFALGLQGEMTAQEQEHTPDFFLLLHGASFLYGLVGSEERTFPLLSSSEIAFLQTLPAKFRGTGVSVAATEATLKSFDRPCAARYIGFVSSDDGKYTYKLYQILEGCSDLEKALCLSYDEKFQKGIGLFCQDDFYLARNLFSAILKSNPNDGIARWYLFACEHFFHKTDPDGVTYSLFGVEE